MIRPENVGTVLPRFFHLSTREAREVFAELSPHPAPPTREVVMALPCRREHRSGSAALAADSIRAVPTSGHGLDEIDVRAVPTSGHGSDATWPMAPPDRATPHVEAFDEPRLSPEEERTATPAIRRDELEPLTAELRRYHVTVSKRWVQKLNAAKAALSHSIPSGDGEQVLEAALDALLEREAKRRGLVKNPRKPLPTTEAPPVGDDAPAASDANPSKRGRQTVPAHVRREVLRRDERQCQAKLHDGTICGSKVRLQFDHVQPIALCGPSTAENLRMVCEQHNQLVARKIFGEAWMDAASP